MDAARVGADEMFDEVFVKTSDETLDGVSAAAPSIPWLLCKQASIEGTSGGVAPTATALFRTGECSLTHVDARVALLGKLWLCSHLLLLRPTL